MKQNTVNHTVALKSRTARLTMGVVCGLLCCVGIAFVVRAHVNAANSSSASPPRQPPVSLQSQSPVQLLQFGIYDVGFYPRTAYAHQGVVAISFEDISGGNSDIVVERVTESAPQAVGRIQHFSYQQQGKGNFQLEAGTYQMYVADHPENRATIIVEP